MSQFEKFVRNPWVSAVASVVLWYGMGAAVKSLGHIQNPWAEAAVDVLVNLRLLVKASPLYTLIPRPKDDE